jgi:hypothetical protein
VEVLGGGLKEALDTARAQPIDGRKWTIKQCRNGGRKSRHPSRQGVPNTGRRAAKGVPNTGRAAKGVLKTGQAAKGVNHWRVKTQGEKDAR